MTKRLLCSSRRNLNRNSLILILVIDYLLERFERGQIYTWIGTLLLVINPDGEISTDDNIYDLSRASDLYDNVCDVFRKEVAPHIFAVAARARYRTVEGLGKPSQVNPESLIRSSKNLSRQNNSHLRFS